MIKINMLGSFSYATHQINHGVSDGELVVYDYKKFV